MRSSPASIETRPVISWPLILSAVTSIHAGKDLRTYQNRAKLLCQLAWARTWLSRWMQQESNCMLQQQTERNPQLLGFVVWPYIHAGWIVKRRFDALSEHLQLVDQLYPWLALGEGDRREILSLDSPTTGLRLELDRPSWFIREGALVFNLFLRDHRLMSVAFSLAREHESVIAYLGGIQGSNREGVLDVYRELTKTLHGLRPRDFTLKGFQLFAGALGVTRIRCVADECRHHRHSYFGNSANLALHLNYDEVWEENGGRRLPSGFFELAVVPAAKPLAEVPARKRAMYRRRYQMLAEMDGMLRRAMPGSGRSVTRPRFGEPAPVRVE